MEENKVEEKMEEEIKNVEDKIVNEAEDKDISNTIQDDDSLDQVSEAGQVEWNKYSDLQDTKKDETKKKDKNNLYEEIDFPEGITANVDDDVLIVKKDDKELKRKLGALIDVKIEGNKIVVSAKRSRKTEKKLFGTFKAHIKNMIKGLGEGFNYKLKIANVHFPMNVSYDDNKKELTVKNFLGEKKDRVIKLLEGVNVKVDNEEILIDSYDIERAGQVATKIEKGTRVRNKDRRVFQDGIFIIEKPGRVYL